MRLSIVVACKSAAPSLDRSLDSIVGQRHSDNEVVVVDAGSRDGTVEILERRAAEMGSALIWLSKADSGIAEAWNRAIALASGDWILFLGADDRLASPTSSRVRWLSSSMCWPGIVLSMDKWTL